VSKSLRLGVNLRPLVPAKIGGMENYARNLLDQLARRDASEIESICVYTSARNHDVLRFEDRRVRTVQIADEGAGREILTHLSRDGADALFCPLVDLEPKDALIPSFVTIPDVQHEVHPEFFDPRTLSVLREIYPVSVGRASTVFTLSEFSRQGLMRSYGADASKIVVVPLDVDEAFRKRYESEERREVRRRYGVPDRYVLYPAITWPHKNHSVLLRAVRAFNDRRRPVAAVFTGSAGPAHRAVLREIEALRLDGQVSLLGHIPQRELACLYQDALALVCPSLFEGFGLPILEAFWSSCPVICSETTSCPEVGGDAALYIDPREPETIVGALESVVGSAANRARLIGRGHERAERFSWAETGRVTFEAMRTAVDAARRPIAVDTRWPTISVVTPSLNQAKFITETIESVLSQDYPHVDYIVIDGGSTDDTPEILRRYGNRLRWVSEHDRGQADAVNKGVVRTRGEIIGWLNSDDTYAPHALGKVARAFARSEDLAVVYGDADHVREDGSLYGPYPTAAFDYRLLAETCFICQPAAFVRRKALDEVGGVDASLHYCMDYDLWIRLGRQHQFAYLPEVLARSRLHKDAKTLASRRKVFSEIIATVKRHYGVVPFEWAYGYADHLFNRSTRDVFSTKRPSAAALWASVGLAMWLNRGRPDYWPRCFRPVVRRALSGIPLGSRGFEGKWGDGWVSRSYVSEVPVAADTEAIVIRGRHEIPGRRPLTLAVFVDRVSMGAHIVPRPGPFTLAVPLGGTAESKVRLEIVADRAYRPLYRGQKDGRLLSWIVDDVRPR